MTKKTHSTGPLSIRFNRFKQALVLLFSFGALMACQAQTTSQDEVDPSKYQNVTNAFSVSTGDKIEVAELFWFKCGHCFTLEPSLKRWSDSKADNAELIKVPAIFSARWAFEAQAFYTMQTLNAPETAYDDYFKRIHIQRRPINDLAGLTEFLSGYDLPSDKVESAFNSFEVDTKMRNAKKISLDSGATGVPAIIVDGKYLTSVSHAGSTEEMFKVVDQLIKKAAAER